MENNSNNKNLEINVGFQSSIQQNQAEQVTKPEFPKFRIIKRGGQQEKQGQSQLSIQDATQNNSDIIQNQEQKQFGLNQPQASDQNKTYQNAQSGGSSIQKILQNFNTVSAPLTGKEVFNSVPNTNSLGKVNIKKRHTYKTSVQLLSADPNTLQLVFTQTFGSDSSTFEIGNAMKNLVTMCNIKEAMKSTSMYGEPSYYFNIPRSRLKDIEQKIVSIIDDENETTVIHYNHQIHPFLNKIIADFSLESKKLFLPYNQLIKSIPLTEQQQQAIERIKQLNGKAVLADPPGSGKSLAALAAALTFGLPIIILAPTILHQHWNEQIDRFVNNTQGREKLLKYITYNGGKKRGEKVDADHINVQALQIFGSKREQPHKLTLEEQYILQQDDVYVVYYEEQVVKSRQMLNLAYLNKHIIIASITDLEKIYNLQVVDFNNYFIIIDEVHEFCNIGAAKTEKMLNMLRDCKYTLLLTATPILNEITDLYPLLRMMGLKFSYSQFMERYCNMDTTSKYMRIQSIKYDLEVKFIVNHFMIRRQLQNLKVPMVKRFVLDIKTTEKEKIQPNISIGIQGYREQCKQKHVETRKVLLDFQLRNVPFIVFFVNLNNFDAFADFPNSEKISGSLCPEQRLKVINRFQSGEILTLFCTIDSISCGLDITRAQYIFWLQMEWTIAMFQQAEGRIRRLNSPYNIVYSVILSNDNYWDQRIKSILEQKQQIVKWICGEEENMMNWERIKCMDQVQ